MIIISTEVPDFFRKVHSTLKVEPFGDFLLRTIPKEIISGNEIFVSKLIEDFKKYNDIYVRIPIKGDIMYHNEKFYSIQIDAFGEPVLIEVLIENKNYSAIPQIEIDLLRGYYYDSIEKISHSPQTDLIKTISKALGVDSLVDYLNYNNLLKQYVKIIEDLETSYELELYDKWVVHNLNLIKKV
jgi:hypothetical protein